MIPTLSHLLRLVRTGTHEKKTSRNKERKHEAKVRLETEAEQTSAPPHPPPSTPVLVLSFCVQFAQSNLCGPSFGGGAVVLLMTMPL